MSALRISLPGRDVEYVDLGPGSAAPLGPRGTFAVPERAAGGAFARERAVEAEARKIARAAQQRAWREANRDRLREYERARGNERQRRYLENEESRLAHQARVRAHWAEHKDEINAKRRAAAAARKAAQA